MTMKIAAKAPGGMTLASQFPLIIAVACFASLVLGCSSSLSDGGGGGQGERGGVGGSGGAVGGSGGAVGGSGGAVGGSGGAVGGSGGAVGGSGGAVGGSGGAVGGSGGAVGGSGGTGGGAAGGSGQCGTQPPTGAPFNCRATYSEQSQANCALDRVGTAIATSGLCERYQQARISYGFYTVTCSYESGTLVWAQRCEDSQVWCGTFCTVSTGAPTPSLSCALTQQCTHAAAAD
jgi:hypothetical protein